MKTKKNSNAGERKEQKGKVKVGKLQINEKVTDLTGSTQKQIRGGVVVKRPLPADPDEGGE